jgi:hypothetical protein
MNKTKPYDETQIAEEIVSVLPAGVARACSSDRGAIRFAVRGDGMKLKTIVLRRDSLRRLAEDPAKAIKIEYLQRDLLRTAEKRTEFRYPRLVHHITKLTLKHAVAAWLPLASAR